MEICTTSWERIAKGLLGPSAINQDKLDEEGEWKQHVILGFIIDTSTMSITLPEAKIASAHVLMESILAWEDSHIMPIKSAQQLRGCMEHFCTANPIWKILSAPVDELLTFGDENNEWVSCPVIEIWQSFRCSMDVIETCMKVDTDWETLFHWSLLRLLPLAQRLSLKMEGQLFIWITVDATLDFISGISWRGREFFRISIVDLVRECGFPIGTVFKIGECEMLAAAFATFLWGVKQGIPRNIILCTDNRNVSTGWGKRKQNSGRPIVY